MPAALPVVLRNFCECSSRLSQIFTETKQVFEDINTWGLYDDAQVLSVELLAEEELEVAAVSSKPPCIVILGQSIYCKARLANEFFKQEVLPPFGEAAGSPCPTRAVRIRHGDVSCASLSLPDDYTLIDDIEVSATQIKPIPRRDIVVTTEEASETDELAPLEITLNHGLLRPGAQIFIAPSCCGNTEKLFRNCVETMLPIFVYGLEEERLTEKEMEELAVLQTITNIQPVFFVRVPPPGQQTVDTDPPDGAPDCTRVQVSRHTAEAKETRGSDNAMLRSRERAESIRSQLSLLGYLNHFGAPTNYKQTLVVSYYDVDSRLTENFMNFTSDLTAFVQSILQSFLVNATVVLNNAHTRCLSMFIMSAFDMARDLMVTPKKLEFAEKREAELYQSLMQLAVSKQHEIRSIIQQTIISMTEQLGKKAENYEFVCVSLNEDGGLKSSRDLKLCTSQIQDLVLHVLNMAIADKLINSVNMLRDLYTGTLTRCLESLEKTENNAVDGSKTTDALKQILTAAYHVEITFKSSSSLICVVLEKMKQLIQSMPWKSPPRADGEWKKKVALDMLNSLSEARLAKSISSQIRDRLNKSHESFASALRQLELKHSGRMDRIEMERLRLRKVHAPKAAKLALESTSLKDLAIYGMPRIGREIGRGQYGVVYSCDKWGDFSPCAIKSVVPPDEKHWNDLALEFYYTKNIPEHERIVSLRGSVIDYMYCGGLSPAVLLIMDRLQKDLHAAIKQHLDWGSRLQVAIDVVEGIRFLHSQGLVHRDIKMKNVLLDKQNRGKLTDLGFCKPEAMMSGSIVGTPIHMAPELFSGRYDNSVDTYAFGILFWYVCAGKVYLPMAFDQCTGKDHLWQAVKKGLRPERLPTFDDECWTLMQQCWDGNPDNRPLLGNVEEQLKEIQQRLKKNSNPRSSSPLRGNNRQKYVYVRCTKHHN